MKKLFLGISTALVLASSVVAEDFDLKKNMYDMLSNMNMLQQGFLTNNKDLIDNAAKSLLDNNHKIFKDVVQIKGILPKGKENMASVGVTSSKQLDENLKIILDNLKTPKRPEASQKAFLQVQNSCMLCHNIVRDW